MVMILKIKASTRNLCIVFSVTTPQFKKYTLRKISSLILERAANPSHSGLQVIVNPAIIIKCQNSASF